MEWSTLTATYKLKARTLQFEINFKWSCFTQYFFKYKLIMDIDWIVIGVVIKQ